MSSPAAEPATCEVVKPVQNNSTTTTETKNENENQVETVTVTPEPELLLEHDPDYCPPCGRG